MPLTSKGQEILKSMEKTYGAEKAKEVLYASKNKGTITGIDAALGAVADSMVRLGARLDAMCSRADARWARYDEKCAREDAFAEQPAQGDDNLGIPAGVGFMAKR